MHNLQHQLELRRRIIFINREKKRPLTFYERLVKVFSFIKYPTPRFIRNTYSYYIFHNKYNLKEEEMFSAPINLFIILISIGLAFYLSISITQPNIAIEIFYGILLTSITLSGYLFVYPKLYENIVKTRVTSESIWVLAFMIIYLRKIPNIEKAIEFVATYLDGYIASEFADIIYDIETKRFPNIDTAINHYSRRWIEWNNDFAYAMSLILSIRYIRDPYRVQKLLDRVLDWYIRASNERILLFSTYIKPKVIVVSMFLIMLPIIGIMIIPILATFLPENIKLASLFYIYNVFLPIVSYILIQTIISQKPFAFQTPNLSLVPNLPKDGYIRAFGKEIPIFPLVFPIGVILSIPALIHLLNLIILLYRLSENSPIYLAIVKKEFSFIPILTVLSMIFGIGLSIGLYFYLNSFQKIRVIRRLERIEEELPMMITTLENALYSGLPLEKTILKVSQNYKIVFPSGELVRFLEIIVVNVFKFGMTLKEAVFNKRNGAILYYPSLLLREVMNLIVSSSEKSIESVINVSQKISKHLEEINSLKKKMISELSDPISTLKMIIYVILPIFGGIAMISQKFILQIFVFLIDSLKALEIGIAGIQNVSDSILKEIIDLEKTIPVTMYMVPIGIYIIETVIISGYFLSGILYGFDKTNRDYLIGKALLYNTIALTLMVILGTIMIKYLFSVITTI